MPSLQELLHKLKQAGDSSRLEYRTDISVAMRDTLFPDGPAIVFAEHMSEIAMLISARSEHVDFIDRFGIGFLHSERTRFQKLYTKLAHGLSQSRPKGYSLEETPGVLGYIWATWIQSDGCNTRVRQKPQQRFPTGWNRLLT